MLLKTATNQSVGVLAGIFLTLALLIAVIGHYALENWHIFDSTNQKRMVMLLTEKNRRVCSGQGDFRLRNHTNAPILLYVFVCHAHKEAVLRKYADF